MRVEAWSRLGDRECTYLVMVSKCQNYDKMLIHRDLVYNVRDKFLI